MIEKAEAWITSGQSVEKVQSEILDLLKSRSNPTAQPAAEAPRVSLTDGESKKYSLLRAIRFLAGKGGGFGHEDAGFELEVSREIARKLGRDPQGLFLPTSLKLDSRALSAEMVAQSRALSTTAGAGGQTVFTDAGAFIDLLRNALVVRQLGATILSDLVGPVLFPKQLTAGTLTWTAETPGSDVTDSDLTTGSVSLSPKSAQSSTAYSRQLLAQSSVDVEALVRADLVAVNAQGIDKAAIQGTGTLQPLGVTKQSGIGDVPIGTDGGYPTYAFLVDLETKLYAANILITTPGLLTTPGIRGYLKKTPKVANFPEYIWRDGSEQVLSYRSLVSNNVPSTLTKGSKTDCHAIILGNWSDLIIGEWGVIEIIVDPYRLKKQAVIEVTSFVMVDVALRYPVAFAAILDARIVA
jgi:HK97 family phage major capsid protein